MNISRKAYFAISIALILSYLALWLMNFQYVYGWDMDDTYYFHRGLNITKDITSTFDIWNYTHLNHLLFGTIPIILNYDIPSFPLQNLEETTGLFRGDLLFTILLHGFLLLIWVLVLDRIRLNRLIALSALVLLVTGPTLAFWAPLPDSRMLGLLAFLPGWLILTTIRPQAPLARPAAPVFAAGVLFSIAQSLQYTTLYIIIPVVLVYLLYWLVTSPDRRGVMVLALAGMAGCLTVPVLMEGLSALAGVPLAGGPLMTCLERWGAHRALPAMEPPPIIWIRMFNLELGWLLCFLALVGMAKAMLLAPSIYGVNRRTLALLAVALLLGLLQQIFSGSQAMFRQVSVWLPFLFVFVAIGSDTLASLIPGRRPRLVATLVLLVAASIVPVRESIAVFQGQLGVGKALTWAAAHADGHGVRWLPIAWFSAGEAAVQSEAELRRLDPDDLLISYYANGLLENEKPDSPHLKTVMAQVAPLFARPTLYATNSMWSEIHSRGNPDYRQMPLLAEVRVYRVGDIVSRLPAP